MRKALLIVVAAAVLTGCGSDSEPATVGAVTQAYRQWDDAAIAGDAKTACSRMTERFIKSEIIRTSTNAKDCKGLIKADAAYAREHPEIKNYRLSQVEVAGNRATLTDQTPYEKTIDTARMGLVREDGRWKVDSQELIEDAPTDRPPASGLES